MEKELKQEFQKIDKRFDVLAEATMKEFDEVHKEIKGLNRDVKGLKKDVTKIRAVMVTKDYLDEKLGKLRGELISVYKQEREVTRKITLLLAEILRRSNLTTPREKEILKTLEQQLIELSRLLVRK